MQDDLHWVMRIFLTGASGYIGGAVAEALMQSGHSVVGMARSAEQAEKLTAKGIEAQRGDLRDAASLEAGARATDAVIHTAAVMTPDAGDVDRAAVTALLRGLAGSGRPFVYTSGCWVIGNTGDRIADEDTPVAPTPLVAWRPAVERMVLEADGVKGIVIRPAMVYGRGGGLTMMFVGSPRVIGDGNNRWAMVHADDLADLYVRALGAAGGTLLFAADGPSVRVRDIAAAAGAGRKLEFVPLETARESMGAFADALVLDQQISGERAKRTVGWSTRRGSVLEELARTA